MQPTKISSRSNIVRLLDKLVVAKVQQRNLAECSLLYYYIMVVGIYIICVGPMACTLLCRHHVYIFIHNQLQAFHYTHDLSLASHL